MRFRKGVVLPLLFGAVAAMVFAVSAFASHSKPLGAAKDRVVFVPAFKRCLTVAPAVGQVGEVGPSNSTHSPPLSDAACSDPPAAPPPVAGSVFSFPSPAEDIAVGGAATAGPNIRWNSDDTLSLGKGDGFIEVRCFDPTKATTDPAYWTAEAPPCSTTPGDNMDIFIHIFIRDVECAPTKSAGTSCGPPNIAGKGADYTGRLLLLTTIRVTDHWNDDGTATFTSTGTKADTPFGAGVQCVATAATVRGGDCFIDTSANQVVPGVTVEDKRGDVELGQISVIGAGDDGAIVGKPPPGTGICPPSCTLTGDEVYTAGPSAGTPAPFLRMGIFAP